MLDRWLGPIDAACQSSGVGLEAELLLPRRDETVLCGAVHVDLLSGPAVTAVCCPKGEAIISRHCRHLVRRAWTSGVHEWDGRTYVIRRACPASHKRARRRIPVWCGQVETVALADQRPRTKTG